MAESRKFVQPKAKKKKSENVTAERTATGISAEDKKKLKALDEFIEGVLQEAGEEFIDDFKQVEGE